MFSLRKCSTLKQMLAHFEFDNRNTTQTQLGQAHVYQCVASPLLLAMGHKPLQTE